MYLLPLHYEHDLIDNCLSVLFNNGNINIIINWDTLNQVKLSIELEKQLDRKLTSQEILSFTNLKNITAFLAKINFDNKI